MDIIYVNRLRTGADKRFVVQLFEKVNFCGKIANVVKFLLSCIYLLSVFFRHSSLFRRWFSIYLGMYLFILYNLYLNSNIIIYYLKTFCSGIVKLCVMLVGQLMM